MSIQYTPISEAATTGSKSTMNLVFLHQFAESKGNGSTKFTFLACDVPESSDEVMTLDDACYVVGWTSKKDKRPLPKIGKAYRFDGTLQANTYQNFTLTPWCVAQYAKSKVAIQKEQPKEPLVLDFLCDNLQTTVSEAKRVALPVAAKIVAAPSRRDDQWVMHLNVIDGDSLVHINADVYKDHPLLHKPVGSTIVVFPLTCSAREYMGDEVQNFRVTGNTHFFNIDKHMKHPMLKILPQSRRDQLKKLWDDSTAEQYEGAYQGESLMSKISELTPVKSCCAAIGHAPAKNPMFVNTDDDQNELVDDDEDNLYEVENVYVSSCENTNESQYQPGVVRSLVQVWDGSGVVTDVTVGNEDDLLATVRAHQKKGLMDVCIHQSRKTKKFTLTKAAPAADPNGVPEEAALVQALAERGVKSFGAQRLHPSASKCAHGLTVFDEDYENCFKKHATENDCAVIGKLTKRTREGKPILITLCCMHEEFDYDQWVSGWKSIEDALESA